jgi:acetyl-CoA carboxylase biotin carboxylase subunit
MKVFVANRGEIAVRILRTCRELGLPTVAVYSTADQDARHTRYADEAVAIGPTPASESYLNILAARRVAREAGLPVLPGPDVPYSESIPADGAGEVTFPVLIKAVAGGGGKGIRLAHNSEELGQMVAAARREAQAAFGDDTVYLEPLVQKARHIEVQILGDGNGNILYLGERECSIQRRRQKLIEEAPAPGLSDRFRQRLYQDALTLAKALNYRSLGTIEFLLDSEGKYYFIEVNPRVQVEHPVTEMITGLDLVKAQLHLAETNTLEITQNDVALRGSAIEARVLAEDPEQGYMPSTGEITYLEEPGGPGIRVDSALYVGMKVTVDYDSLLAKVIAWGEDRDEAIRRLRRALSEFQISGVATDISFLAQILASESFVAGRADTTYLDTFQPPQPEDEDALEREVALATALLDYQSRQHKDHPSTSLSANAWRLAAWREQMHG